MLRPRGQLVQGNSVCDDEFLKSHERLTDDLRANTVGSSEETFLEAWLVQTLQMIRSSASSFDPARFSQRTGRDSRSQPPVPSRGSYQHLLLVDQGGKGE